MNTYQYGRNILCLGALALAGCGGGSSGDDKPPQNRVPQLSGVAAQSVLQDTTSAAIPFSVSDADTSPASVVVTVTSSNTDVVPSGGILVAGNAASRTLQITPAEDAVGNSAITIRAVDPDGNFNTVTFRVDVTANNVSFLSTATAAFVVEENGAVVPLIGKTVTQDVEDPAAFDAQLQ